MCVDGVSQQIPHCLHVMLFSSTFCGVWWCLFCSVHPGCALCWNTVSARH